MEEFISHSNPKIREVLLSLDQKIFNICEDAYIEPAVQQYVKGYSSCLAKSILEKYEYTSSFEEIIKEETEAKLISLLFRYALFRELPSSSDADIIFFKTLLEDIKSATTDASASNRILFCNILFAKIALYIIKKQNNSNNSGDSNDSNGSNDSDDSNDSSDSNGSNDSNGSGDSNDSNGSNDSDDSNDSNDSNDSDDSNDLNDSGDSNDSSNSNDSNGSGDSNDSNSGYSGNFNTSSLEQALKQMPEETYPDKDVVPNKETGASIEENSIEELNKNISSINTNSSPDNSDNSSDLLYKSLAQKMAEEKTSEEICKEESLEDESLLQGIPSDGMGIDLINETLPSYNAKELYEDKHEILDIYAKRCCREMKKTLTNLQIGDNVGGLYSGKINSRQLYRTETDLKTFQKKILPTDVPDIEVILMIDASGSMYGSKATKATESAYVLWAFCKQMDIPCSVYTHTTNFCNTDVKITTLVSGNNPFADGKSIFNYETDNCNKDGFALRFVLDKIKLSNAKDKIIIFISDGLPSAYSSRAEAIDDIANCLQFAKKEDINVITIAVSDQREVPIDEYNGMTETAFNVLNVWCNKDKPKKFYPEFIGLRFLEDLPKALIKAMKPYIERYM